MKCNNCGNEIIEGNAFCTACGTPVAPVVQTEPQPDIQTTVQSNSNSTMQPATKTKNSSNSKYIVLIIVAAIALVGVSVLAVMGVTGTVKGAGASFNETLQIKKWLNNPVSEKWIFDNGKLTIDRMTLSDINGTYEVVASGEGALDNYAKTQLDEYNYYKENSKDGTDSELKNLSLDEMKKMYSDADITEISIKNLKVNGENAKDRTVYVLKDKSNQKDMSQLVEYFGDPNSIDFSILPTHYYIVS